MALIECLNAMSAWDLSILTEVGGTYGQGYTITISKNLKKAILIAFGNGYDVNLYPNINNISFSNGGTITEIDRKASVAGNNRNTVTFYEIENVGIGTISVPGFSNANEMWVVCEIE